MGNLWPIGIASSYEAATRGQRVWADVAIHRQGTLWMGRGEMKFDVADTDDGVLGVLRLLGFMVESNPFNPQLFDRRGTLSLELLLRGTRAGVTRVKLERMMVESGDHPLALPRVMADIFEDEAMVVVTPTYFVVQTMEEPLTWLSVNLSSEVAPPTPASAAPTDQPDP
jgi:hypothetical protein